MTAPMTVELSRLAQARLRGLGQRFELIARTRMAGLPIVHPGLRVSLEGFREEVWLADGVGSAVAADVRGCVGVLLTPWSMSLLRLPLSLKCSVLPVGHRGARRVGQGAGAHVFDFLGGSEEGLGRFELCSLFSPMTDFADQASAVATACAVMAALFEPEPEPVAQAVPLGVACTDLGVAAGSPPTRRWFLSGGVAR